jgi:hypothetical protein
MNNKNIRMKRKRKKRSKECEQRKPDIDNKECVKAYDEYACNKYCFRNGSGFCRIPPVPAVRV